jgi:hypothetical protein
MFNSTMSWQSPDQASYAFSIVFAVVWLGSLIVTFNALLLGGKMYVTSFSSSRFSLTAIVQIRVPECLRDWLLYVSARTGVRSLDVRHSRSASLLVCFSRLRLGNQR